ncbi:zinc protease [Humitalea rosea]|uniref:Zinc protease n=1 Tax=Humitalea rosea TaxID=990373 RepID=A0A2W7IRX7_9PROT|nr:pitrilysin family protein [Humitalea rosea]PZW50356.1 zinc protease [Humitalea rosea]
MTGFSLPIQAVSGGDFTAWLVEDHSVPVVSLSWSWPGGAALDPPGVEGATSLAMGLLTSGAGDLPETAMAEALRDAAISLNFNGGRDESQGGFRCLTNALPEAVRLARLCMTAPRLDAQPLERGRARALTQARAALETPRGRASRAFWPAAFPGHPIARPTGGTEESLPGLDAAALRAALARQLRQGGLLVTAAGAITPGQLAALLPELFGALPAGDPPGVPPLPMIADFGLKIVPIEAPQSFAIFTQQGLLVADPDWEAAQVVLRILGGGGFSSRLMEEIRTKRGLTYGIYTGFETLLGQGVVLGTVATENARMAETISVLRQEWVRMAAGGPTAEELADAVAFLTGNQPLQFTDSLRIASGLLALRRNGRSMDWLDRRPERLAALIPADTSRVAARLLHPQALSVLVAGQPVGL